MFSASLVLGSGLFLVAEGDHDARTAARCLMFRATANVYAYHLYESVV